MSLKERLPDLANFLGSWFPDADLEGRTDQQVVHQFKAVSTPEAVRRVTSQLEQLLASVSIPTKEIVHESNRLFESEDECRRWLEAVLGDLQEG